MLRLCGVFVDYLNLREMHGRSRNCRRRRRRPRRWPWRRWPLRCWPLCCWPLGRGPRHRSDVRCHRWMWWWLIMKVLAKGFADSLFPTVLLLLLSLRGSKLISVGKSGRFVPWAGVSTAPRGWSRHPFISRTGCHGGKCYFIRSPLFEFWGRP